MRQEFRNRMARFGPIVVMALMACSVTYGQDVRTNYRPGTDFSKYHTYKWVDEVKGAPSVGIHPDQILDSQIKQAIDSQMAAKGFTKVEDDKGSIAPESRAFSVTNCGGSGLRPSLPNGQNGACGTAHDLISHRPGHV